MWVALRGRPGWHERTGFNNFLAKAAVFLLERSEESQPVTTGIFGFRDYSGGQFTAVGTTTAASSRLSARPVR